MSVYFIGCAHLGHRNIAKFRSIVQSDEDNTRIITKHWRETITKRDVVYMMGDAAFTPEAVDLIGELPGRKILIKGNHDDMVYTSRQTNVFEEIHGMLKYKGMWLTHCPIHPDELRGKNNVHAHVHHKSIMRKTWYGKTVLDKRYLNTCVDSLWDNYHQLFISLDQVKAYFA